MSILRAREAFAFTDSQGVPRVVRPGDLFDDSDPSVVGREKLFEPVEVAAHRAEAAVSGGVEAAVAAPGEKRSVTTTGRGGRGRGAAKAAADEAAGQNETGGASTAP
ncbi:hypothetical protein HYG77_04780 [Rhodococcus sp. ZPP]|uniref:hypothetical protein n=1 Tax=Rhodococcus sp. ZPP TaxID=2749906 RepID=UPI001AD88FEE|nr:hypothetical protein [Rhodococcus sp. ZPP]QTJ64980.1 hypothetical protein HYG77_04780 [Rhodococcus sp. ZPP]